MVGRGKHRVGEVFWMGLNSTSPPAIAGPSPLTHGYTLHSLFRSYGDDYCKAGPILEHRVKAGVIEYLVPRRRRVRCRRQVWGWRRVCWGAGGRLHRRRCRHRVCVGGWLATHGPEKPALRLHAADAGPSRRSAPRRLARSPQTASVQPTWCLLTMLSASRSAFARESLSMTAAVDMLIESTC